MAKPKSSRSRKSGGNGASSAAARGNDAEALLRQDHRTVEKLFKDFESAKEGRSRQELARQICRELVLHSLLEEEVFYPACREKAVEDELLDEAQVEHDSVKLLVAELLGGARDPFYAAKVRVLSEYVKHHVKEEEKRGSGIFAKARKAGVDMVALGGRLRELKQHLERTEGGEGIPPFRPRALRLQQGMFNGNTQEVAMERGSYGRGRDRDERGRFTDDDDNRGSRGGRGQGRGGWFGDSEGRSRAAQQRGGGSSSRFDEDDDRGSRGGRSGFSRERDEQGRFMSDDDDNGGSRGGRGQGRGGWFGDSRGHSEAARRGARDRD